MYIFIRSIGWRNKHRICGLSQAHTRPVPVLLDGVHTWALCAKLQLEIDVYIITRFGRLRLLALLRLVIFCCCSFFCYYILIICLQHLTSSIFLTLFLERCVLSPFDTCFDDLILNSIFFFYINAANGIYNICQMPFNGGLFLSPDSSVDHFF